VLIRILRDQFQLLTFRSFKPDLRNHYAAYLTYGLVITWVAGMGRYWDNPKALWWQAAGLGSIAYVFILAALLWLLIWPLRPVRWRYRDVLLFLTLTSLPAWLYAIPVEMFMPIEQAKSVNAWFLAIVATWRVILLVLFLRRGAGLSGFSIVVATLLPLAIIVSVLAALNLEHVVFNIMAGNQPAQQSANDSAYLVVVLLTFFAYLSLIPLLLGYIVQIILAQRHRASQKI
jgi:hypothetical protein